MAAFTKFGGVKKSQGFLRHMLREVKNPRNIDIDPDRTCLNYSLTPNRDLDPAAYLEKRLKEVHCMDRKNVKVMCGWIITKPKDLPESDERRFFELSYKFLAERYGGEQNVISADVHKDEGGEPHLHFCFVPIARHKPSQLLIDVVHYFEQHPDETNMSKAARESGVCRRTVIRYRDKTEADIHYEKVSAFETINRADLLSFHGDLRKFLKRNGIDANVNSGITREQGGNKSIEQMKRERLREQEREREIARQNNQKYQSKEEHKF